MKGIVLLVVLCLLSLAIAQSEEKSTRTRSMWLNFKGAVCPGGGNCNNQGTCGGDGKCACFKGYGGDDCSYSIYNDISLRKVCQSIEA